MQILQYYQKRRWVLDLGIRLTLIHERVGIDQRNGNRLVSAVFVFPYKSSWVAVMPNFQLK